MLKGKENMSINVSSSRVLLEEIAIRASTPPERYSWDIGLPIRETDARVQARIERLFTMLDITTEEKMQQFLLWHHLDPQQLAKFLSTPLQVGASFPAWVKTLERVVSQQRRDNFIDRCIQKDAPLPFEEILLPFLWEARRRYQLQGAISPSLIEEQVQMTLERWLLHQLCEIAGKPLLREFARFRSHSILWGISSEHSEIYEAFVAQYHGEGLLPFFQEYSVLARLLILLSEQWVNVCTEFVQRLKADRDAIGEAFYNGQDVGPIIALQAGCSDSHHQGRTVFIVTFAQGLKIVYKPRCLNGDQAFANLLQWGNHHGLSPSLKTVRVLSRATYGWAEYITQESCTSRQEVQAYYLKTGMLIGWLYILGAGDMHNENLIASGEDPILVDLETAISPGFPSSMFQKELWESSLIPDALLYPKHLVLGIGMLPETSWMEQLRLAWDISGIGGVEEHTQPKTRRIWTHINTDTMSQEIVQFTEKVSLNTVLFCNEIVNPLEYGEEVAKGFRIAYHFLIKHRDALFAQDGPLKAFRGCPLRFIRRPTQIYGDALQGLTHPDFLREGTDRWIELQVFMPPMPLGENDDAFWKIAEAEVFALQHLDIPRFGTRAESCDLELETGETVQNIFPLSAIERAKVCLAGLDEVDLAQQSHLIRTSFQIARPFKGHVQEIFPSLTEEQEKYAMLSPSDLMMVAHQIAWELKAHAHRDISTQQEGTWIGLQLQETSRSFRQARVGLDLYDGASGITLFLAALDHVTGEHTFRDLVVSAMDPLCRKLKDAATSLTLSASTTWQIGGTSGLGASMYALSRIGTWLDQPCLLKAAENAALLLTKQRVQTDTFFDVMSGSAGALLGVLSLYAYQPKDELLERAVWCGQQLLDHRVTTESGKRAWPAFQKHPLTGFSHGTAGIVYALLRLTEVTGNPLWKDAAEEALAFEQSLFLADKGNWPDLRTPDEDEEAQIPLSCSMGWCHGAPGIGLARLGGLATLDTPQVRADLTIALKTTQDAGLQDVDALCCGNFGRIELLVAAAHHLEQPPLLDIARQWSSVLVQRAKQHEGFRVLSQLPRQAYNPGLFQGYAGIGYELLRVAYPDQIPSILLWE